MNLTLEIPDDLARELSAGCADLSRRALEAFALDEYRSGRLTENGLKAHDIWIEFSVDDVRRDVATLERPGFRSVQLVIADTGPVNYLLMLPEAFNQLKQTNFRYPQETMDQFLAETSRDQ